MHLVANGNLFMLEYSHWQRLHGVRSHQNAAHFSCNWVKSPLSFIHLESEIKAWKKPHNIMLFIVYRKKCYGSYKFLDGDEEMIPLNQYIFGKRLPVSYWTIICTTQLTDKFKSFIVSCVKCMFTTSWTIKSNLLCESKIFGFASLGRWLRRKSSLNKYLWQYLICSHEVQPSLICDRAKLLGGNECTVPWSGDSDNGKQQCLGRCFHEIPL